MPPRNQKPKVYAAPEHGALDQEIVLDVTVRVALTGTREKVEAAVRAAFERDLQFMFPGDPKVIRVKRATR